MRFELRVDKPITPDNIEIFTKIIGSALKDMTGKNVTKGSGALIYSNGEMMPYVKTDEQGHLYAEPLPAE